MAANKDLIAMARRIGQAEGYNDISGAIDKGFEGWNKAAEDLTNARIKENDASSAKLEKYMDGLPGANIPKIPPHLQDAAVAWAKDKRMEYGDAAEIASKLTPKDEGYAEAVSTMNSIKNQFVNMDSQFNSFMERKQQEVENIGTLGVSNSNTDRDFLTSALTDNTVTQIDENGNLLFDRGGEFVPLGDLPKTRVVNSAIFNSILGTANSLGKSKTKMTEAGKKALTAQLYSVIKSQGRDGLLSAATDHPTNKGEDALGIPDALLQDESRNEELMEKVVNHYADSFEEVQNNAAKAYSDNFKSELNLKNSYRKNNNPDIGWLDKLFALNGNNGLPPGEGDVTVPKDAVIKSDAEFEEMNSKEATEYYQTLNGEQKNKISKSKAFKDALGRS